MSLIVALAVLCVRVSNAVAIDGSQLQECTISQPGDSCNARLGGGEFIAVVAEPGKGDKLNKIYMGTANRSTEANVTFEIEFSTPIELAVNKIPPNTQTGFTLVSPENNQIVRTFRNTTTRKDRDLEVTVTKLN